jgi:hypothetical protein
LVAEDLAEEELTWRGFWGGGERPPAERSRRSQARDDEEEEEAVESESLEQSLAAGWQWMRVRRSIVCGAGLLGSVLVVPAGALPVPVSDEHQRQFGPA